jgi:diguanylate cyclase (GGDEF)-like protein
MINERSGWEKALLFCVSLFFAIAVIFAIPPSVLSLGFFIVPIILSASYYGLTGGIGAAILSVMLAFPLAGRAGIHLQDAQLIAYVIIYFLVGCFSGFMQREQRRLREVLRLSSITDELTSLYNYQHFRIRLEEEVKRAKRYGHALALVLCDVDRFKLINDTFGHHNGNFALNKIAYLIKDAVRESDIPFRYGGDEFAVILPETGAGAAIVARRIVSAVNEAYAAEQIDPALKPSLTAGVAYSSPEKPLSAALLISFADEALYKAKRAKTGVELCTLGEKTA